MSTKRDSTCLQKAAADEPIFVLRAQDALAGQIVREWAERALLCGVNHAKVAEALIVAKEMDAWPTRKIPT